MPVRVKIIRFAVAALFACIALNLFYVQVIRGPYYYSLSKNNRIRIVPIEATRGRILDRNGTVLADSKLTFNVLVVPQEIKDEEKLFAYLGDVLEKSPKDLLERFKHNKFTPFAPVIIASDLRRDAVMALEENKFRFPGLLIQAGSERWYPFREISAHVLGYVGKINRAKMERLKEYGYTAQSIIGYSGVEEFYDQKLKGQEGGLQIEVNSRGQQVRLLSFKEPSRGQDITLTIDNRIQKIAYEVLQDRVGTIIVMDMDNGEILGLTNSPSFDPNFFSDAELRSKTTRLFSDSRAPLLNRAIGGQYPPGSVFKVALAYAALTTASTTPNTTFNCPGYYQVGQRRFGCTHLHGPENLREAITHSCNVYFYHLGLIVGADTIHKFARLLGLGEVTGIDLPYEESGFVPSSLHRRSAQNKMWYKGDTLNLAIGQGELLTTPLQLVQMMARIGSNGKVVQPHLLQSSDSPVPAVVRKIPYAEKVFTPIQDGLSGVVKDFSGTAHILDIPGIPVAGKTGTAQSSGGRPEHSWFVGYTTIGQRSLVFCVFLEFGGSSYNAAFLARNLLVRINAEVFK